MNRNKLLTLSLVCVFFSVTRVQAESIKTILPLRSSISTPVAGELAYDPSVGGPVLFHQAHWRSFTPAIAWKYPNYVVTASSITFSGDAYAKLGNGDICSTDQLLYGTTEAISALSGDSSSTAAAGWNYIYMIEDTAGDCYPVASSTSGSPAGATTDVLTNHKYRYLGSLYLTGSSGSFSAMPMVKSGNKFYYSLAVDTSGDTLTTNPIVATSHTLSVPAFAITASISGTLTTQFFSSSSVYVGWATGGMAAFSPRNMNSNTSAHFEELVLPAQSTSPTFSIGYIGTLSSVTVVSHVEDPLLFFN